MKIVLQSANIAKDIPVIKWDIMQDKFLKMTSTCGGYSCEEKKETY
jgi:hypothetical protein